jgi:hypothetical protein
MGYLHNNFAPDLKLRKKLCREFASTCKPMKNKKKKDKAATGVTGAAATADDAAGAAADATVGDHVSPPPVHAEL